MKKKLLLSAVAILLVLSMGAGSLTTRVGSYRQLDTIADVNVTPDTDLAAATGFFVGTVTDEVDLLAATGGGKDTFVNAVSLILHVASGTNGDTVTQVLYGRSDGGPPQRIASVVWTIGLAQVDATSTNLWAETAVVTSSHSSTIGVEGAASDDRPGSITFDVSGFRYIKSFFTAETGAPTTVTCLYRYF